MAAASARFAKDQLEMGGSNPLVILNDADIDQAVEIALRDSYFSTGQRCTASSRLIVEKGILPKFTKELKERVEKLIVDDARKAGTQICPVASADQFASDLHRGSRQLRSRPGHGQRHRIWVDSGDMYLVPQVRLTP